MQSPEIALDLSVGQQVPRPDKPFTNEKVWKRTDIGADDWIVSLGKESLKELHAIVRDLRLQNLPIHMLRTVQFEMSATRVAMKEARRRAYDGIGFSVVDRLPLDEWTIDEAMAVQWLVLSCVSQPVAQECSGQIFRDIMDTAPSDRGIYNNGLTEQRLTFHTDNSGNRNLPNFSTLMCLYKAEEGGMSEYCTLYSLVNAMMEDAPEQLNRLFQPFYHNRQDIQIPGEPDVSWAPAIGYDGERLLSRISSNKIPSGYTRVGKELDNLGRDALESVYAVIRDRDLSAKYMLERGQVLVFNNREGMHHREPYFNGKTMESTRHLVRMWLRDEGRPFFDG
jgi:hypothetical protein